MGVGIALGAAVHCCSGNCLLATRQGAVLWNWQSQVAGAFRGIEVDEAGEDNSGSAKRRHV